MSIWHWSEREHFEVVTTCLYTWLAALLASNLARTWVIFLRKFCYLRDQYLPQLQKSTLLLLLFFNHFVSALCFCFNYLHFPCIF